MGGSVSSGRDNDELIDNLVEGSIIQTPIIEKAFRAIDRGIYYLPKAKDIAYRDLAWRDGNFHISAPGIYSKVMENLELHENLSFLNVGSGTGYLSSMVGLLIGPNGINHGLEMHHELVDYAKKRTIEFVKNSVQFDDFDFCVPKFIHGNCMNLNIETTSLLYDRIYVGACGNEHHEELFINLLKVNGILIMPLNDSLLKIKKIDEKNITKESLMTVSFASLISPTCDQETFNMPRLNPQSLQELCRFRLRKSIRQIIKCEKFDYFDIKREKSTYNKIRQNELNLRNDDKNELTCPLTRFERHFLNRLNPITSAETSSLSLENQFRIMIYGRILDAALTNTLSAALGETSSEDSNGDLDEENITNDISNDVAETLSIMETEPVSDLNNIQENSLSISNSNSNIGISDSEKNDSNENLFQVLTNRFEEQTSSSLENLFSDVNQVETLKLSETTCCDSRNESTLNSNCSNEVIKSDGQSSSYIENPKIFIKKETLIKRKRNFSSGYSTDYSSSFNENHSYLENTERKTSPKAKFFSNLDKKSKESSESEESEDENFDFNKYESENDSENDLDDEKLHKSKTNSNEKLETFPEPTKRKNLLREKIMQLPISAALKEFLLYYRDI